MDRIGFIGLGLMGAPMATNILRAGYPVSVYNRSIEKTEPLVQLGAQVFNKPSLVARASDVVITMLSDARAVEAVMSGQDGVLLGSHPGQVLINMSTISPEETRRLAAQVETYGVKMLDAPVMGSTGPAAAGTLEILVGGEKEVFESQRELLGVLGKSIHYLGPTGSGAQMKLSMNLIVAAELICLAEAMVLAAKGGLDLAQASQIISASNIASNLISRKVNNIVKKDFTPAFSLKNMQKDLGLIMSNAANLGAPLPASSIIHQLFTASKEMGHAEEDSSAIYRLLAELAGLSS